jgi:hypothetical protein
MNKSEQLDQLFTALSKAQGEIEIAGRKAANPFFKSNYADLAEIVRVSRPHLVKNGLCVSQWMAGGNFYTMLGHTSGQWIQSELPISPAKTDVQSLGSYISYLRRYSYSALIGVVDGECDDDGESQMDRNAQQPPKVHDSNLVSKDQYTILDKEMKKLPQVEQDFLMEKIREKLKVSHLSYLPHTYFESTLGRIRETQKTLGV